jgi:hypothetical protein
MRGSIHRSLLSIGLFTLAASTASAQVNPPTATFDSTYMETQILTQTGPDYPWSRTTRHEQPPKCVFEVVLSVEGKVLSANAYTYQGKCTEPYLSSAKRAVRMWTWRPQFRDGVPVQVSTSVTVDWEPTDSPMSIEDSTQQTAVSIVLKSGSTIHADTAKQGANGVSYTIGDDTYEIPSALVDKVVNQELPAAKPAPRTAAQAHGTNWTFSYDPMFATNADLRSACASNPKGFQTTFPQLGAWGPDICDAVKLDMGKVYETTVDDTVNNARTLCAKYQGAVLYLPTPTDPNLINAYNDYQKGVYQIRQAGFAAANEVNGVVLQTIGKSYADLESEQTRLNNLLSAKSVKMDPQYQEQILNRLKEIGQQLQSYAHPTEKDGPAAVAASMKYTRTSLDLARVSNIVCKGTTP